MGKQLEDAQIQPLEAPRLSVSELQTIVASLLSLRIIPIQSEGFEEPFNHLDVAAHLSR